MQCSVTPTLKRNPYVQIHKHFTDGFLLSFSLKTPGKNSEVGFNLSLSQQWLIKQSMRISWDRALQPLSLLHRVTWPSLEQHWRPFSISQQDGFILMALKPFHSLAPWLCKYSNISRTAPAGETHLYVFITSWLTVIWEVKCVNADLKPPLVQGKDLLVRTSTQEVFCRYFMEEAALSPPFGAIPFLIKHPDSHGGRVWRMTPGMLVKTFSWKVWHAGHSTLLQLMLNYLYKEDQVNKNKSLAISSYLLD